MNPENVTPPPQPSLTPEPSSTETPRVEPESVKKKRNTLPITVAFLAGALIYAVLAAGYNLYLQSRETKTDQTITTQKSTSQQVQPDRTGQAIADEDLNNYVEVTDCSTKPAFSSYKQVITNGKVNTIDLYDGINVSVTTGNAGKTYGIRWSTLPKVVDYKCNDIKITAIEMSDRINVYADATTKVSTSLVDGVSLIQKANK